MANVWTRDRGCRRNVGAEIGGFIGWFVDFSYFFLAIQKYY